MKLLSLLRKEFDWSRHRWGTVVVLFVLVPAVFATGTMFFEHTVPENSPVAIVPENDDVTDDDLAIVRGSLTFISDPTVVEDRDRAFRRLTREETYAVVEVPPDVGAENTTATIDVYIHGGVTIYRLPSRAITTVLSTQLDDALPGSVVAERTVVGEDTSLSEYLLPTFLMIAIMLVAFTYLPYTLAAEQSVYDRLRIKTSIGRVIGAKLLYVTALVVVTILTGYLVGLAYGYTLEPLAPTAVFVYLLAFVALASLSTAVMFLTEFSDLGRILNVAVFFALVPLSNLAYPAGFFSPLSKAVARSNPLHYAMIVARSHLLKDIQFGLFTDWLGWLVVWTLACVGALALSIRYYTYTQ